jgi:hypothetical protein
VRDIGSTCTCSVGVMSIVLARVTGPESAVVESAGMGCTNGVGIELLGTGFANTMRTGSRVTWLAGVGSVGTGLTGSGSTGMALVSTAQAGFMATSPGTGLMGTAAASNRCHWGRVNGDRVSRRGAHERSVNGVNGHITGNGTGCEWDTVNGCAISRCGVGERDAHGVGS